MAKRGLDFEFNPSPTNSYDIAHFDGHINDFQNVPVLLKKNVVKLAKNRQLKSMT